MVLLQAGAPIDKEDGVRLLYNHVQSCETKCNLKKNPPGCIFCESRDRDIYQQYYMRANLAPCVTPVGCLISEI